MIVDISSITIKLSAPELVELLIALNEPLRKSNNRIDDRIIVNYNLLCESCGRNDLIIC